jgi:non-canonical (house-cleaning) NTP pyrophosphatase
MSIILCTTSDVKLQAVREVFPSTKVITYNTSGASLPEQPLNCGYMCCQTRINFVKQNVLEDYKYIIAIENVIDTINLVDPHHYLDVCHVIVEDRSGNQYHGVSKGIKIHKKYIDRARLLTPLNYNRYGLAVTAGTMIAQEHPEIDHADWMASLNGIPRKDQIKQVLKNCLIEIYMYKI